MIFDEANPLGTLEQHTCWVHFWIAVGLVLTLLYGSLVTIRRIGFIRGLRKDMDEVLGAGPDGGPETAPNTVGKEA